MDLQHVVIVRHPLLSKRRKFNLGIGAKINIKTCNNPPLLQFIREEYTRNPDVLIGDIRSLLAWRTPYGS